MFVIAKNLVRSSCTLFRLTNLKMNIRNTKPVIPKLVTDNLDKQQPEIDLELINYLQEQDRLGPLNEYDQILPGLYCTYPSLVEQDQDSDYMLRSKRHRVAKLKRAKRRDGKKTHIQNN